MRDDAITSSVMFVCVVSVVVSIKWRLGVDFHNRFSGADLHNEVDGRQVANRDDQA